MKDDQSDEEVDREIEELSRDLQHEDDEDHVHTRLLEGITEGETPPEYAVNPSEVRKTYRVKRYIRRA